MKTVRVAGKQYGVVVLGPVEALRPVGDGKAENVVMMQVLVLEDGHTPVGKGHSWLSPKDEFNSRKGIEIALRRALTEVRLTVPAEEAKNPHDPSTKPRSYAAWEKAKVIMENARLVRRPLTSEEKEPFYRLTFGPVRSKK